MFQKKKTTSCNKNRRTSNCEKSAITAGRRQKTVADFPTCPSLGLVGSYLVCVVGEVAGIPCN